MPLLFSPGGGGVGERLGTLVMVGSLLATAYTLWYLPLPPVQVSVSSAGGGRKEGGREGRKGRNGYGFNTLHTAPTTSTSSSARHKGPVVPYLSDEVAALLEKYIIPFNAALCVLLAVAELFQDRSWSEGVMIGGRYLPGLVLGVVIWARRELRVIDLGELDRLRDRSAD